MPQLQEQPQAQAAKPAPADGYDVVVIGAGPGGYVAAIRCAQLGLRTLCVDEGKLGGVCLNVGCIPSKALISAAKDHKHALRGAEKGLTYADPIIDLPTLMKWKQGVVDRLVGGVTGLLKANKVETAQGRATFTAPDAVEVAGPGGRRTVKAKAFIVATGSSTVEIPGFKFDERRVLSSTGALELQQVPRHLCIIGGGVIGLELGCAYANLGSKVTIIEMMDQLLPGVDADVAKGLERILRRRKWDLHLGARAKEAKATASGVRVTFEVKGLEQAVECDHVLVSVGRRPNTKG
ncbi:MAG TPA: FAD-dependent oxidoreductase, partial [Candidatus Thermoplasmatota archaeon]|nr:FAD-dependent oxidoreductase [Candidatus Thermoplasmatota archaeon]